MASCREAHVRRFKSFGGIGRPFQPRFLASVSLLVGHLFRHGGSGNEPDTEIICVDRLDGEWGVKVWVTQKGWMESTILFLWASDVEKQMT